MRAQYLLVMIVCLCLNSASTGITKQYKQRKVLLLGIDGLKADVLEEVVFREQKAPAIQSLMENGKFAACADYKDETCARAHSYSLEKQEAVWKTAPGWASVLTGVDANKHKVNNNHLPNLEKFAKSAKRFPSFLKTALAHGFRTGASGVTAFLSSTDGGMESRGVLDHECGESERKAVETTNSDFADFSPIGSPTETLTHKVQIFDKSSCNLTQRYPLNTFKHQNDSHLQTWLENKINNAELDVVMVVFNEVDRIGHKYGFSKNAKYMEAIANVDKRIASILQSIQARKDKEEWLVILTSDHGGHATSKTIAGRTVVSGGHNTRKMEDSAVPFIVTTFGAESNLSELSQPVTQMDSAATILSWLGIKIDTELDGVVQAIR